MRSRFITYNDSQRTITESSDRNCFNDSNPVSPATCQGLSQGTPTGALVKTTWYDQLGHVRLTQDWVGNFVQNEHWTTQVSATCSETATAGYELTSNPFVTQSESTMGWTRTKRDTMGRVIELKHYSGAGLPPPFATPTTSANCTSTGTATYAYNANVTTFTDEAYHLPILLQWEGGSTPRDLFALGSWPSRGATVLVRLP